MTVIYHLAVWEAERKSTGFCPFPTAIDLARLPVSLWARNLYYHLEEGNRNGLEQELCLVFPPDSH